MKCGFGTSGARRSRFGKGGVGNCSVMSRVWWPTIASTKAPDQSPLTRRRGISATRQCSSAARRGWRPTYRPGRPRSMAAWKRRPRPRMPRCSAEVSPTIRQRSVLPMGPHARLRKCDHAGGLWWRYNPQRLAGRSQWVDSRHDLSCPRRLWHERLRRQLRRRFYLHAGAADPLHPPWRTEGRHSHGHPKMGVIPNANAAATSPTGRRSNPVLGLLARFQDRVSQIDIKMARSKIAIQGGAGWVVDPRVGIVEIQSDRLPVHAGR